MVSKGCITGIFAGFCLFACTQEEHRAASVPRGNGISGEVPFEAAAGEGGEADPFRRYRTAEVSHPARPPAAFRPWFGGCWDVLIAKRRPVRKDSLFRAKLRIDQWDTSLVATLTLSSGGRDSVYGSVGADGIALAGFSGGAFTLKARLDAAPVDSAGPSPLHGLLVDPQGGIAGPVLGSRANCDTLPEPLLDTALACSTCVSTPAP